MSEASAKRRSRAVRAGKVGAVRAARVPRSGLKLIVRASKRITRFQVGRGTRFLDAVQRYCDADRDRRPWSPCISDYY